MLLVNTLCVTSVAIIAICAQFLLPRWLNLKNQKISPEILNRSMVSWFYVLFCFSSCLLHFSDNAASQSLLIPEESETLASKKEKLEKKEGEVEDSSCLLVAIDSGVSRRPPGMKVEHDRRVYSKTIELLLHDEETAANLLREISFGFMGPPFENEPTDKPDLSIDHQKVTKAFQRGLIGAIRDMQILRMFLVKLYRTLDHLLREFMVYVSSQSDMSKKQESSPSAQGSSTSPQGVRDSSPKVGISTQTEVVNLSNSSDHQESALSQNSQPSGSESTPKSTRFSTPKVSPSSSLRKSPGSSPRLNSPNRVSPLRENWHGKGSAGRMTIKLKDVSRTAKVICLSFKPSV